MTCAKTNGIVVKPPPKRANGKRGKLASTHARDWQVYRRPVGYGHLYQGRYKSFPIEGEKGHCMTKDRWERLRLVFVGAGSSALWQPAEAVAVGGRRHARFGTHATRWGGFAREHPEPVAR